jgi:hypothetical protein
MIIIKLNSTELILVILNSKIVVLLLIISERPFVINNNLRPQSISLTKLQMVGRV